MATGYSTSDGTSDGVVALVVLVVVVGGALGRRGFYIHV